MHFSLQSVVDKLLASCIEKPLAEFMVRQYSKQCLEPISKLFTTNLLFRTN